MEEIEGMVSLRDFFVQLGESDRRWTRQQLVFQLERLEYRLSEAVKVLRFPSDDDDLYLARGEKAARDLEALFGALRQVKDGVPLEEICVPATILTEPVREEPSPSPYVITEEIGTPLETLGLSPRVYNIFKRFDFNIVESVLQRYLEEGEEGLLLLRNFGDKALEETLTALREKGFLE